MINLKTIVKQCTEKGYIPLRNGRKQKLQKQSILIRVKFLLGLNMAYLFYCINRFGLEWPLRKGIVMGSLCAKCCTYFRLKLSRFYIELYRETI